LTFYPEYPIANMKPAPYNPRLIDENSLEKLKDSIRELGLIKPVIVTANGTLLAGHQRTRAMQLIGLTHCPAFALGEVSTQDEIRFNQLHNSADLELGEAVLSVPPQSKLGFVDIPPEQISGQTKAKNASKRAEILRLLNKHGPWGSIIVNQSGNVLVSKLYAMASRMLGYPCKAYVVPDGQEDTVFNYFSQRYGRFSYAHLPQTTWAQSWAQPFRLREPITGAKPLHSRTYECLVIPRINKEMRILDFGAGQMDYVKKLKSLGYDIHGIEFYFRKGAQINVGQVNRNIDALCYDIKQNGLYDLVVSDSVINSVTSVQAEQDVLTCLSAFCKPNGTIICSGRSRDFTERREAEVVSVKERRVHVHFFDDDGFTAIYSKGVWRYQKFHFIEQAKELATAYFGNKYQIYDLVDINRATLTKGHFKDEGWGIVATKQHELPLDQRLASLSREFDLPLPEGRSYGRQKDILQAYQIALAVAIV
jgi:ParB family transcriptional regulator, chromosome partitioning protein